MMRATVPVILHEIKEIVVWYNECYMISKLCGGLAV